MKLENAIEGIFTGESVLFIGSGFSFGATNSNPKSPLVKSSTELSNALLAECGMTGDRIPLTKASQVYLQMKNARDMVDFLKKEFIISSISPEHEYLASLKWQRIYTTNYDDIIELGLAKNHRIATSVTLSDNYKNYPDNKTDMIVHLNGFIRTLNEDKLNSEFKLTNSSYLASDFVQSQWYDLLINDLRTCKSVFFVGFSMDYDLDLEKIIVGNKVKEKAFFIVSNKTIDVDRLYLSSYGNVHPINLSGFVKEIKKVKSTYNPIHESFIPISFKELKLDKQNVHVGTKDFYELLISGEIKFPFIQRALQDRSFDYVVNRTALAEIVKIVNEGQKNILVESALGNGKTVFLMQIAANFLLEGKRVFWYEKYTSNVYEEIRQITKLYPDAILILDDYHTAKEVIRCLTSTSKTNVIITAERQSYHDAIYDEIQDVLGGYSTISINRLDNKESIRIDDLFTKYSVWGNLSVPSKRKNYLKEQCHSQISLLILSRIKSTNILKKFSDSYDYIKKEPSFKKAFVVALLSEFFKLQIDTYDFATLVGASVLNNPSFRRNIGVQEFFNFEESAIRFKSSIVARYFLEKFIEPETIIDTLVSMMRTFDAYAKVNPDYKSKLTMLMNYTQLSNCLGYLKSSTLNLVLSFYERVMDLPSCKDNIHFWLQYAIARLAEENYAVAKLYFEKCYALAGEIEGYKTYKIDNHYSRYLLENAIANSDEKECMEAFRKAHKILVITYPGDEKTTYSYRMASKYIPFYEKFYAKLSKSDQLEFLFKCDEMKTKCAYFIRHAENVHNIDDVKRTERQLNKILKDNDYIGLNENFKYGKLR